MAVSYVGGATAISAGNTDVSVDLTALTGGSNSAPSAGDLVIFAYNIADADNVDLDMACITTGFDTNEIADLFGNGTQDANLGVYWKFMTATPDTGVSGEGSLGGNDTAIQAAAMVFRGVASEAQGGPFDVAAAPATGTTTGDPVPASINTTGAAGIWTVVIGSDAHAANVDGTFTAPANYATDWLTRGSQDTTDGIIGMGYNPSPSDPEAPGTITTATTATGWCALTIALKPAPATVVESGQILASAAVAVAVAELMEALRQVVVSATAAASVAGARVASRSVAVSAVGDAAVSGIFFGLVTGAVDVSATTAVSVAPQRALLRQVASTASVGAVVSGIELLPRGVEATATTAVVIAGQRDALRQVVVSAVSDIVTSGATVAVVSRSVAVAASADASVVGQRALLRQVASTASTGVAVRGEVEGPGANTYERQVDVSAASAVVVTGIRVLQRAATVEASTQLSVAYSRDLQRAATAEAIATLQALAQLELSRAVVVAGLVAIASSWSIGEVGGATDERGPNEALLVGTGANEVGRRFTYDG